jgi:hypothetical protein
LGRFENNSRDPEKICFSSTGATAPNVELEAQPTVNPEDWAEASSFTVG